MLKTNCKVVNDRIVEHILDYYENDIDNIRHDNKYGIVSGGCLLCLYSDVRNFLQETLEETEEEANKYDDQQVWALYETLCNRAINTILKGVK